MKQHYLISSFTRKNVAIELAIWNTMRKKHLVSIFLFCCLIFIGWWLNSSPPEEPLPPHFKLTLQDTIDLSGLEQMDYIKKSNAEQLNLFFYDNDPEQLSSDYTYKRITLTANGIFLKKGTLKFEHGLTDYLETKTHYYTVNTLRVTMGKERSHDFLSKYDSNWKLLWTKELTTEKHPAGNSYIRAISNHRFLLISDSVGSVNSGISITTFDTEGKRISEALIPDFNTIYELIQTSATTFVIIGYDRFNSQSFLAKIHANGTLLWKRALNEDFYPAQIAQTQKGDILLFGDRYLSSTRQNIRVQKFDSIGKLVWELSPKDHYTSNASNFIIDKDRYLFSSSIQKDLGSPAIPYLFELDPFGQRLRSYEGNSDELYSDLPFLIKIGKDITLISRIATKGSEYFANDTLKTYRITRH